MGNSTSASNGSGSSRQRSTRSSPLPVTEKAHNSQTEGQGGASLGISDHGTEKRSTVLRNLVFWRNGFHFHIFEGQGDSRKATQISRLCSYDDPQSQTILKDIIHGYVPSDLAAVKPGQEVEVHVLLQPRKEYSNGSIKVIELDGKPGNNDQLDEFKAYLRRVGCSELLDQLRRSQTQNIQKPGKPTGRMYVMYLKGGKMSGEAESFEPATRYLIFYRNGFVFLARENNTIKCSKLRLYEDPSSAAVLQDVARGIASRTIMDVQPGQVVQLLVVSRLKDDFVTSYVVSPSVDLQQNEGTSLNANDPVQETPRSSILHADSNPVLADPSTPLLYTSEASAGVSGATKGDFDLPSPPSSEGNLGPTPSGDTRIVTTGQESFDIAGYLDRIGCSSVLGPILHLRLDEELRSA